MSRRCRPRTRLFSGHDGVTGVNIAVELVAAGGGAAASIDQDLQGEDVVGLPELWSVSMEI